MKRRIITLILLGVVAAALPLMLSCGDDSCPTCPTEESTPPYKGWLYFTSSWDAGAIYRIDTETGDPYDSVLQDPEFKTPGYIGVSPDGQYLAVSYCCYYEEDSTGYPVPVGGITRIYDAQTLVPILDIQKAMDPLFPSRHNIMVGLSRDSIFTYGVPDFQLIHSDSIGNAYDPYLYERDTLIYAVCSYGTTRVDSTGVIAYNYLRHEVVDKRAVRTEGGDRAWIMSLDIHPDGRRMYFLGGLPGSAFASFGCYDLHSRSILFTFPMFGAVGDVKVRPDGKEVYVTDPGGPLMDWPTPGTIFIFDADNGQYIDGISLFGYGTMPGYPAPGGYMAFSPTGERAFVAVGRGDKTSGTILTVDTKERRVIHVAWSGLGHIPWFLAIGPKL